MLPFIVLLKDSWAANQPDKKPPWEPPNATIEDSSIYSSLAASLIKSRQS